MSTEATPQTGLPPGFSIGPNGVQQDPPSQPDPGAPEHVTLGRHSLPVYPQSLPYLEKRLGKTITAYMEQAQTEELSAEGFFRFIGDGIYEVLSVLIPALPRHMPEFEWHGYESQAAMDAGGEIAPDNPGPTWAQIVDAGKAVWSVNRFDVLGQFSKLVDPTKLKTDLTNRIRYEMATRGRSSDRQSSSPSRPGTSPQEKPSGTGLTTGSSEGSPSPGSSPSPAPTP